MKSKLLKFMDSGIPEVIALLFQIPVFIAYFIKPCGFSGGLLGFLMGFIFIKLMNKKSKKERQIEEQAKEKAIREQVLEELKLKKK